MTAAVMDTRAIAASLRQQLQQDVLSFSRQYNQSPGLVILGLCDDQGTIDIARIVGRNAPQVGIRVTTQLIASNARLADLRRIIEVLNNDPTVHAISLQLPLPKHLDVEEVSSLILPEKEVEGEHPIHQGRLQMGKPLMAPPPALATMRLLSIHNINPAGRHVVIVGRNLMIGKPLQSLMIRADATVTLCHSATRNLATHTRQAEILVSAAGVPGLIKAEMVRPGAVVIDYGINYINRGKVVGDVDYANVLEVAGAVTPMPGGIGPLTIIALLENTLKAARMQQAAESGETKPTPELDQAFSFK
jgi:methylenetetrahydrofolate dehydrogenase (NADP+)/methenyltetrahydrofolate cyclohydrolase